MGQAFKKKFKRGEHKGDLCVFWILYIQGGVAIDSDVLLYGDHHEGGYLGLENTLLKVQDADFVTLKAGASPGLLEKAFITVRPRDAVVRATLRDLYFTDAAFFKDMDLHYLAPCNMWARNVAGLYRPLAALLPAARAQGKEEVQIYYQNETVTIPTNFSYEIQ